MSDILNDDLTEIDNLFGYKPQPKPQGQPANRRTESLRRAADKLGVDPGDLGSIISFETGGTFDPHKVGGEGNKYKGLIQFGPDEQKSYYKPNDTFETQLEDGVVRYFQDRFKKVGKDTRGASLEDLYTTVIAGNPNANRNAKDSFGTSARSGTQRILKEHRPAVLQKFGLEDAPKVDLSATDRLFSDSTNDLSDIDNLFGYNPQADTVPMEQKGLMSPADVGRQSIQQPTPTFPGQMPSNLAGSTAQATPPMPERPETLEMQRMAAHDPASTRAAVLYTPGSPVSPIAKGEVDVPLKDGSILRANIDKFNQFLQANGPTAYNDLKAGNLDFSSLIGGKAQPTNDTANKTAVITRDQNGTELVASSVETPDAIETEAAMQKAQFPNIPTTTEVVHSNDVVNGRVPLDNQAQRQQVMSKAALGKDPTDVLLDQQAPLQAKTPQIADLRNNSTQNQERQYTTGEPRILDDVTDQQQPSEPQRKIGAIENDDQAVADTVTVSKGTPQQQAREALEQLAPKYGFDPNEILKANPDLNITRNGEAGKVDVTYGDIRRFTGNSTAYDQARAEQRTEMPRLDLSLRRPQRLPDEREAEKALEDRIKETSYSIQQKALEHFSNPVNLTPFGVFNAPSIFNDPSDAWVQEEKQRLLKENDGSYSKAYDAEKDYQEMSGAEFVPRMMFQTARSFTKNLISGTGKSLIVGSQLLEDSPLNPVNKLLPDDAKIGLRNVGNYADLVTRLISSRDSATALKEMKWAKGTDDIDKQQAFQALQEFDKAIGDDPVLKGRFFGGLADATGSALAFIALGAAMPSLKLGSFAMGRAALSRGLGRTAAKVAMNVGELSLESGISGGMQALGTGYEEGKGQGLSEDDAKTYGIIQGLIGTSEMIGAGGELVDAIKSPALRGRLATGILEAAKQIGKSAKKEATEEFFQEVFQTSSGNAVLEYLKDKEPDTFQKVKNALNKLPQQVAKAAANEGVIALATGGAMGGAGKAAQILSEQGQDVAENATTPMVDAGSVSIDENQKETLPDSNSIEIEGIKPDAGLQSNKNPEQASPVEPISNPETGLQSNKKLKRLTVKDPVEPGTPVTVDGRGEAVIVQDNGKNVVIDHTPKPGKNGETTYTGRATVRKDKVTVTDEKTPTIQPQSAPMAEKPLVQDQAPDVPTSSEQVTNPAGKTDSPTATAAEEPQVIATESGRKTASQSEEVAPEPKRPTSLLEKPVNRLVAETKKPEKEEQTVHKFSSTQVNLPKPAANAVLKTSKKLIPDAELYIDPEDASYGREETPHVTVKYGLHTEDAEEVRKLLANEQPFKAKLGKLSIFEGDDKPYDVVKAEIESPELHRLNKLIAENTEVTDTFPTYVPHVTLAYVKKGEGAKYVGNKDLAGREVDMNSIMFSSKTGETVDIPLGVGNTDTVAVTLAKAPSVPIEDSPIIAKEGKFSGSLEIPRAEMPQISGDDFTEFKDFAKEKGVEIEPEQVQAKTLKPTQRSYNPEHSASLPEEALDKPLTVSSDNRVLDGHNRLVRLLENGERTVTINRLPLTAEKALSLMKEFPKTTYKLLNQVGNGKPESAEKPASNEVAKPAQSVPLGQKSELTTDNPASLEQAEKPSAPVEAAAPTALEPDYETASNAKSPQTTQFKNEFGSFTSVRVTYRKDGEFGVETTVRKQNDDGETTTVQPKTRILPASSHESFIKDLENRVAGKPSSGMSEGLADGTIEDITGKVEKISHPTAEMTLAEVDAWAKANKTKPGEARKQWRAAKRELSTAKSARTTVAEQQAAAVVGPARAKKYAGQGLSEAEITEQVNDPGFQAAEEASKKQKASPATGFTKAQQTYLTKELADYAKEHPNRKEEVRETIIVPDDGTISVSNLDQANRLHQRISGKPLAGQQRAKLGVLPAVGPPTTNIPGGSQSNAARAKSLIDFETGREDGGVSIPIDEIDAKYIGGKTLAVEVDKYQQNTGWQETSINGEDAYHNGHLLMIADEPLGKGKTQTKVDADALLAAISKTATTEPVRVVSVIGKEGYHGTVAVEFDNGAFVDFKYYNLIKAHYPNARFEVAEANSGTGKTFVIYNGQKKIGAVASLSEEMRPVEDPDNQPKSKAIESEPEQTELETPAPKPEKAEAKAPVEKVADSENFQDFGEKIGGAKKDLVRDLAAIEEADLLSQPLSKVFPRPDFAKLIADKAITLDGAKILSFLYDQIPAKPRKAWKIKGWAEKANQAITIYRDVLGPNPDAAQLFLNMARKSKISTLADAFDVYSAWLDVTGFPEKTVSMQGYEIRRFPKQDDYLILKGSLIKGRYQTAENAAKALLNTLKSPTKTVFNVYQDTKTKEYFVGKKGSGGTVRLITGLDSVKAARSYIEENQTQLERMWEARKFHQGIERKDSDEEVRIAKDWRNGKDIASTEEFAKAFGFRGVEFGNWVKQGASKNERQQAINDSYDALMDLADLLGIEPKALALNGTLGLALGARGSGNASAHYEPTKVVINLTKTRGKGSLGHEWWHALDNYFSKMRGQKGGYVTDNPQVLKVKDSGMYVDDPRVRAELLKGYEGVVKAIRASDLPKRSRNMDATRSTPYWSTMVEMTARSFENYIVARLAEKGERSDFLANFKDMADWGSTGFDADAFPYPLAAEQDVINKAFDDLFDVMEQEQTDDGNVMLRSVAEIDVKERIKRLVDLPRSASQQNAKEILRPLDSSDIARIEDATGIQIGEGYSFSIDKSAINHAQRRHGIAPAERERGQVQVVDEDFERIADILNEPDFITTDGKSKKGLETVIFGKRFNGHTVVIEEVRTGAKELAVASIRKYVKGSEFLSKIEPPTPKATLPSTVNIVNDKDAVNDSLKKVRTEDAQSLQSELRRAATSDVLANVKGGSINDAGELELSEHDAEILRRLVAEKYFQENDSETDEKAFDGVTWSRGYINKLAKFGESEGRQMLVDAGYSELGGFDNLLKTLKEAGKDQKNIVAYVFDDALPEERIHKQDLDAGRATREAIKELKKSPIWTDSGSKFNRDYEGISDADKASEIAAKLATDQAEKYGWDTIDDFEQHKDAFLETWANGIVDKNLDEIERYGYDAFKAKYPTITKYATTKTNDGGAVAETRGAESPGGSRSESSGEARTAENDRPDTTEATAEGRSEPAGSRTDKTSDTGRAAKSAERVSKKQKAASFSRILGQDYYYDPQSHAETEAKAQQLLSDKGTEQAVWEALNGKPSAESMRVVYWELERLNGLADHYLEAGENEAFNAVAEEIADLSAKIVQRQVRGGQEVEIAKTLAPMSPEVAILAATKMKKFAESNPDAQLSPDQTAQIIAIAKELKDANTKLAEASVKLRKAENKIRRLESDKEPTRRTPQAKLLKEYQAKKPDLINKLKAAFPNSPMFNGSQDALKSVISDKQFEERPVMIEELLKRDADLRDYIQKENPDSGRTVTEPVTIGIKRGGGVVIDGFKRIAQALSNGQMTILAYVEAGEPSLRSISEPAPLDPEQKALLTEYGAGMILEGRTYDEVISTLEEIAGTDVRDVHAAAVEMVKPSRPMSEEAKEKLAIRNEHYRKAAEFSDPDRIDSRIKSLEESIDRLEKKIRENDLEPKKDTRPTTPELDELTEKRKELQKELNKLRREAKPKTSQLTGIAQDAQAMGKSKELVWAVDRLTGDKPKSINDVVRDIQKELGLDVHKATDLAREADALVREIRKQRRLDADAQRQITPELRKQLNDAKVAKARATYRLNRFLNQMANRPTLMQRFNNDFRAKLVSNWGTQIFNAVQGVMSTSTESVLDLLEATIKTVSNPNPDTTLDINAKDVWLPMAYVFSNNKRIAEQALAEYPEEYYKVHSGLLGDIELDSPKLAADAHVLTKPFHAWFDKMDVLNRHLSNISGAQVQEMHFRNAIVASSLDQVIRKKSGGTETLKTALDNGTVTKFVTENDAKLAADKALRVTFASMIDDPVGKELKRRYDQLDKILPVMLNPVTFARFTYTTTKVMVANPLLLGALDAKTLGGEGYNARSMAKAVLAWSGVAIAYGLLSAFGGDDDRWETLTIDGTTYDIRRFFPMSAYFYVAHLIKSQKEGRPLPEPKEVLEGFASLETDYFRYGAPVDLAMTAYEATQGRKTIGDVGSSASRMLGSYFAGMLRFIKPAKDTLSQFNEEEATFREYSDSAKDQFIKEISKTLPFIGQTGKPQKDPVTGEIISAKNPLARVVGVNMVHPSFLTAQQTPATEWAEKLFVYTPTGEWTEEQKQAFYIRKRLKQAVYRGDVKPKDLDGRISEFVNQGKLTERSAATLKKDLQLSELQYRLKNGYKPGKSPNPVMERKLDRVMQAATEQEKADIETVIGKRMAKAVK